MLIEIGGWRLLTDPTFDEPGRTYRFGWGTSSRKLAGPAIAARDLGSIDAVLLSHDHHADNLDDAGRTLLPLARSVITTHTGASRLGGNARDLAPWATTQLDSPGRPSIAITATPCRHGPPGTHLIVGDVIGFSLEWAGQRRGTFWISGDTVMFAGVRHVAGRLRVGTAILHLGGVRFPITGPLRYTMTATDAVGITRLLRPHTVVPIHYEGWSHFQQDRSEIERAFAESEPEIRDCVRWIAIGGSLDVGV